MDNATSAANSTVNSTMVDSSNIDEDLAKFISVMRARVLWELITYSILFVLGSTMNIWTLRQLFSGRYSNQRMNYLIRHLTIADLSVVFVTITIELAWRITIEWPTSGVGCKLGQFCRTFGLYLTSAIVVCISLDRFQAFVFPMATLHVARRNRFFLLAAYGVSVLASLPQIFVFHMEYHPRFPTFGQCVSKGYFSSKIHERIYTLSTLAVMYFLPLLVILFCYPAILLKIHISARESLQEANGESYSGNNSTNSSSHGGTSTSMKSRPSVMVKSQQTGLRTQLMARAKRRTLRMSLAIVITFIICWTPYAVVFVWDQFDSVGLRTICPSWLMDICFMFAVTNSCVNPFVHSRHVFVDFWRRARDSSSRDSTVIANRHSVSVGETQV